MNNIIKKDTYEIIYLKKYNNLISSDPNQIIKVIEENEKDIIESIKIELPKVLNSYKISQEKEDKKFRCKDFFKFICKMLS